MVGKFIINHLNFNTMKNLFLILSIFLFVTGCSEKEQNIEFITQNATIHFDPSGIDNCIYTIQTENNVFYTVENLAEEFRVDNLKVKITYTETVNKLNCGFAGNLIIIQIETIEKI